MFFTTTMQDFLLYDEPVLALDESTAVLHLVR